MRGFIMMARPSATERLTAYRANQILGQSGKPSQQDESYNHLIRSSEEFEHIREYIERNPVAAGLVTTAVGFPLLHGVHVLYNPAR